MNSWPGTCFVPLGPYYVFLLSPFWCQMMSLPCGKRMSATTSASSYEQLYRKTVYCTPVSEMTYTVSSGTLNSSRPISYHTVYCTLYTVVMTTHPGIYAMSTSSRRLAYFQTGSPRAHVNITESQTGLLTYLWLKGRTRTATLTLHIKQS